jgi:signal transduction histidine kinase
VVKKFSYLEDYPEYSPETTIQPPPRTILDRLIGLRTKLIAPYLILSLVTAMVGIMVVSRLVTSSIRERFANQILEASRVAAEMLVRQEQFHLEQLRAMAFTQGVAAAITAENDEFLIQALHPLAANTGVDVVSVVDLSGRQIISLTLDPTSGEYSVERGADPIGIDLVNMILQGESDALGDKFAGIFQTETGPYLATSAPVIDQDQRLVGALLISTSVDHFLQDAKQQVLADMILLDRSGALYATTLAEPEDGYQILELPPDTSSSLEWALSIEINLYQRDFQVYYSPLIIRQEVIGVLGVALPSSFIVSVESTSRNVFALVFTLGAMGVIVAGFLLARSIAKPVTRLRDVSLAIASGDLDQRTGLRGRDEIGQLATIFDLMTSRLKKRTDQAFNLFLQSEERADQLSKANMQLQSAQQQIIQSEKLASVGQLTAGIVHDVKNPLSVIKGMAEELIETVDGKSETKSDLLVIRENADHANRIVMDLLKFARLSEPNLQTQNLSETALIALRLTSHFVKKSNVRVRSNLEKTEVFAIYDAQQLEQVFVNLIQNAIQAMPSGGELVLFAHQTDEWSELDFHDTGIGIPEEYLGRIFDPFFTTKPAGEGTGLGLSVSYGLVHANHGQIEVESTPGKGTTFHIRLPRSEILEGGDGSPEGESP